MCKYIVVVALLSGSVGAFACQEELNDALPARLENVRAKLVSSLSNTYEFSHVIQQLEIAGYWEDRLSAGPLEPAERIELNGFVTVQELTPEPAPRPRFPSGSKAEQETERYFGPY